MIPMDISINAPLNVGTPAPTLVQPAAAAAAPPTSKPSGRTGAGGSKGSSFHDELREVRDHMRAAEKEPRPAPSAGHPRREDSEPSQPAAAEVTETQTQPADDSQRCPESRQEPADLLAFLLQVLQGISPELQPPPCASGPDPDAAGADVPEDDLAKSLSQLLDILKQLQEAAQDAGHPGAVAARLSELYDQLKQAATADPSAGLPGQIHQALQDLREHLSGLAWGRMMKEIFADEPATVPGAEKEAPPDGAMPQVRTDASDSARGRPEVSPPAIVRTFRAEAGPVARDPQPTAAVIREASTPGPESEDAKLQGLEREPLVRVPSAPSAPAAHAAETGHRLETARPMAAAADPSGSLKGVPEDQGAPAEGDRQPADHRWIAKTMAGADAAKPENTDPAVPFEMDTAGQRLLHPNPGGSEKAADAVGAGKEKEAVGPGRAGVFDQIVQRAIVQVKTGQSEIKIDLKPDFLGNVRMQIVSENQQVSVRILTELPAVRDMIETGLQQLRSDLQNQGLHVDRLEVAVSDDPRQPPRRQARPGELQKPGGIGAASSSEGSVANVRTEPIYYQRRAGSAATIDMFV